MHLYCTNWVLMTVHNCGAQYSTEQLLENIINICSELLKYFVEIETDTQTDMKT